MSRKILFASALFGATALAAWVPEPHAWGAGAAAPAAPRSPLPAPLPAPSLPAPALPAPGGFHVPPVIGVPAGPSLGPGSGAAQASGPARAGALPAGEFFRLWNRVVERVLSRQEGGLTSGGGMRTAWRRFELRRVVNGVERRISVLELEGRGERPGIPPFFRRTVTLEVLSGGAPAVFEADEDGGLLRGDPRGLSAEAQWWSRNL